MDLRTKSIEDSIKYEDMSSTVSYYDYQPGNGTRYRLLFTFLDKCTEKTKDHLGSHSKDTCVVTNFRSRDSRSMVIPGRDFYLHHSFVQEKLDCCIPDSIVLAEFIGWVVRCGYTPQEEISPEEFGW